MKVLPLSDFIQAMRFQADSNSAFAMGRLKQFGIFTWTLAEGNHSGVPPPPRGEQWLEIEIDLSRATAEALSPTRLKVWHRVSKSVGVQRLDEPIKYLNASDSRRCSRRTQPLIELPAPFARQILEDPLHDHQGTQNSFCGIVGWFNVFYTEEGPQPAPILDHGVSERLGFLVLRSGQCHEVPLEPGEDHCGLSTKVFAAQLAVPEHVPPREDLLLVHQDTLGNGFDLGVLALGQGDDVPAEVSPAVLPNRLLELVVGGMAA